MASLSREQHDWLRDPETWENAAEAIGKNDHLYDLGDSSHRLDVVQIVCQALAGSGYVLLSPTLSESFGTFLREMARLREKGRRWECPRCGPHADNRANWCARGCGRDYNDMREVDG